jgi:hypothetical protein
MKASTIQMAITALSMQRIDVAALISDCRYSATDEVWKNWLDEIDDALSDLKALPLQSSPVEDD